MVSIKHYHSDSQVSPAGPGVCWLLCAPLYPSAPACAMSQGQHGTQGHRELTTETCAMSRHVACIQPICSFHWLCSQQSHILCHAEAEVGAMHGQLEQHAEAAAAGPCQTRSYHHVVAAGQRAALCKHRQNCLPPSAGPAASRTATRTHTCAHAVLMHWTSSLALRHNFCVCHVPDAERRGWRSVGALFAQLPCV